MSIKNVFFNFRSRRKIQVHLLTVFLFLFFTSVFAITRFTYDRYYKSIDDLSGYMIDQTNVLLLERVENIKDEVQLTAEFIKGSIHSKAEEKH